MSRQSAEGPAGLASDADAFQNLVDELDEVEGGLEAPWLYRVDGAAYGPVTARDLLQRLYEGDIDAETEVAPEDGDFLALRRYGAFRNHLAKARELAEARAAAAARTQAELQAQRARRLRWAGLAVVVAAVGSGLVWGGVSWWREADAEARAREKTATLEAELEALLANVSIEPPLMPLVDEATKPSRPRGDTTEAATSRTLPRRRARPKPKGPLSEREVMTGVQRVFGGLVTCIKGQLRRDSDSVPTTIVLTFGIDNGGRARDVSLADRFLRRSPMLGCVRGKLQSARWRTYKGEVRNVEYPITVRRPSGSSTRSRLRQP